MKISIVIAVYESYGATDRQMKHFAKMNLPDDIEFILVDDGSNPPHKDYKLKNLKIHYTNDKRPWTQGLARNAGAKLAKGEYLMMTDMDHILSKEAIMAVYKFKGDKMIFPRHFGVLLKDGTLSQDVGVLEDWGAPVERFKTKRGTYASVHGNTWAMKKSTFELLGGYPERNCLFGHHAGRRQGEDSVLNGKWNNYAKGKMLPHKGPKIYIFPIGRYNVDGNMNPKGLFHTLKFEQVKQPMKK